MSAITLACVEAGYGRKAVLRGATLEVPEGCVTALLGENGAGKTTLLRVCLGVVRPRRGAVRILGRDPFRDAREVRTRIGFVPDRPDAYGWMRVGDLARLLAAHYPTWHARRAEGLFDVLRVPLGTRFRDMSRGEGMKAMLALSLAHGPQILLLDEPFAGLDPIVRVEVLRHVIGAAGERRRTVLLSTHDLEVVARVADRIALLAQGRIVRDVPVAALGDGPGGATTPSGLQAALEAARGEVWPCAGS
jgi:ABC-2 type transport system ATP-binding protein